MAMRTSPPQQPPPKPRAQTHMSITINKHQFRTNLQGFVTACLVFQCIWWLLTLHFHSKLAGEVSNGSTKGGGDTDGSISIEGGGTMRWRSTRLLGEIQQKEQQQLLQKPRQLQQPPPLPLHKELAKPVPAVMCASDINPDKTKKAPVSLQCRVHICPSNETNTSSMPSFLRPFPSAHYGYGFTHRAAGLRGKRMAIAGSAKAGSGCALSHKYKFIYVHVLKSGGMTMKTLLQNGLCGNNTMPCARGTDNLQIVNCAPALERFPHYLVFSFVRNPYSRAYSGYAMAAEFRKDLKKRTELPPFSFDTFALGRHVKEEDAKLLVQNIVNATNTTATQRRKLLEQQPRRPNIPKPHVKFQLRQPKRQVVPHPVVNARNVFRKTLTYLHPSHFAPQTNYLFSPAGNCPSVDFIGHLENIHDDLKRLLKYIDSPELWQEFQAFSEKTAKAGSSNNTADNNFVPTDNCTSFGATKKQQDLGGNLQNAYHIVANGNSSETWTEVQKAIALEYQRDFELLGYDPNIVPMT